ncbi:odorant receptor 67d-like [Bradysia coprophila]|uniref:odorant receptor 67d-like n=1 Tax=Bradysia coprophila TaxID=38358 RepID=UPI00187D9700|nr:odorant receptor 67d-like [Bradysia coprophila]
MGKKIQSKKKRDVAETMCRKDNADNDTTALKRTFGFGDMFSNIVGWKFSYDWKSNPRHWFTCSLIAFLWAQCIYSQIKFFVNGEYGRIFEVFALYGICTTFAQKPWIFMKHYKALAALRNFSFEITRKAGRHMTEKLDNQQLTIVKLCKLLLFEAVLVEVAFSYYPMSQLVHNRRLVPLLPIEVIFLDQTKLSDFLIANAITTVAGLWCLFTYLSIFCSFLMAIFNCSTQVDLIEDDFRQLDALWSHMKTTTLVQRQMFLRNICQKCQDRDNFIDEVKRIFDGPIFVYFCVAYMAQVVCLYEIQMKNWMSGYAFAIGGFFEMLLYCLIGTEISKKNERLYYVLTQCNWYTYDICSQKIFLNLLNSCMNAKELWIGPLAPLSVITWIQMVKSIYSYYTFLSEVV